MRFQLCILSGVVATLISACGKQTERETPRSHIPKSISQPSKPYGLQSGSKENSAAPLNGSIRPPQTGSVRVEDLNSLYEIQFEQTLRNQDSTQGTVKTKCKLSFEEIYVIQKDSKATILNVTKSFSSIFTIYELTALMENDKNLISLICRSTVPGMKLSELNLALKSSAKIRKK